MNNFLGIANLKIGTRLALGFSLLIALMLGLTAIGTQRVANINASLSTIGDLNSVKQRYAINFRGSVHDRAIALRDVTLVPTQEQVRYENELIQKLASNYAKSAAPLDKMFADTDVDSEERAALAKIKEVEARAQPLTAKVIELRMADQREEAGKLLLEQARPAYVEWLASINRLIDLEETKNKTESANARALAQGFSVLMLVLSGIAIVAALGTAWAITRSIVQPIHQAASAAQTMATGDLVSPIQAQHADETGQMLRALEALRTSFRTVLVDVRQSSDAVAASGTGISHDTQDVSARTESQASALEETAASMEELGSTVRQNADHAKQANQLAVKASTVATEGGKVVAEVVETMRGINESSQRISDIIGVIDSIAFQTNILALNAAVEAARAGEQGRGFAVVASEVRNLAGRSAEAAKEIKGLISTSVDRVAQGSALVDRAGKTMTEVVVAIRHVTDIVAEISAASGEQAMGVAQAGEAIVRIDQATQQNAILVAQMAAAANDMRDQSQHLVEVVGIFRLGHQEQIRTVIDLPRLGLQVS
ncbi:methyl-accepting chemotaxis protein [Ralstonia pseudosolanacearum]|uniref:methyl-accepting chemotaxis protein n=1 Tax=Ralstonia pseudosolanacearum TaxID=1310165 RepID=UPI003CED0347